MGYDDPIDDTIPPEYQNRQREEQEAQRRDVEETIGLPVPEEYREARRRAREGYRA
jgi:hypothetical protein